MKKIAVVLMLLAMAGCAWAADDSLFDQANAKYQSGDFKSAAALYEQGIQSGQSTASTYYNLGNARFRLKQKGKAMASYERALSLSPRDPDIQWNIDVLRSILTDRLEESSDNFTFYWIKNKLTLFTPDEMNWDLTGLLGLLALMVLAGLWLPKLRSLIGLIQGIAFFLLLMMALLFIVKWNEIKDPRVVILDKEVTARYGPSEKETAAFLLHEGAKAKATDASRDWLYITLENKNSGWIRKESCEII